MKKWWGSFWPKHGDRLIFGGLALAMAAVFMGLPDLKDSGKTILIGVAMLCYNKARSGENTEENK